MQTSKEDIRAEILRQAAGIFGSRGFARSSMRDIAEAARVCPSNIYNYFPGKDALFREVVRPAVRSFDRMLEEHHGRQGADIMEMLSESYFRQVVEEYVLVAARIPDGTATAFFPGAGIVAGALPGGIYRPFDDAGQGIFQGDETSASANRRRCFRFFHSPAYGMDVHAVRRTAHAPHGAGRDRADHHGIHNLRNYRLERTY